MVLVFLLGARSLANVFLPGLEDGGTEVATMAVVFLRLAALYILADSAQLVFVGALRGAGDTRWVMVMSVTLHWGFAGVALILIKVLRVDPVLAWVCFIGVIIVMGVTFFLRFLRGKWEKIDMIGRDREAPDYPCSSPACPEVIQEEPIEPAD